MNLRPIEEAYGAAVTVMLAAVPGMSQEQAMAAVEAIAELVLATIQAELTQEEEQQNAIDHH